MTRPDDVGVFLDRVRIPLRLAYVGVLLLATLSGYRLDGDPEAVVRRLRRMLDPSLSARDAIDGARNVLLFAGWGLVWMATVAPGPSASALRNAALTGAGLSLFVEGLQLFSATRTASVLDLATNTLGAALGAFLLVVTVRALFAGRGKRSFVGVPAAVFGVATTVALLGEAFVPLFRQSIQPWAVGGPLRRFTATLGEFRWGALGEWPLRDTLLFLPGGVYAVAALAEASRSYRSSAVWVAAAALPLFAVVELAHGALGMEILGGAILVHGVAVGAGAVLAAWGFPAFSRAVRGVWRARVLLAAHAGWFLLWAWRPYVPEPSPGAVASKLTRDWWIPLRFLGERGDLFSVADVMVAFFLFVPMGALLAVWPLRRSGAWSTILPALYFAVVAELSQAVILTRTPDVTDALVQAAGAAVGWIAVRRAGFRAYGEQLGVPD